MTTKPSSAPWVDGPYKLVTTPSAYRDVKSHVAVYCATEMAHAHNCLTRGLNAIVLQAPHIPSSRQAGYVEKDVEDLMFYVQSWVKVVDHHHHTEETVMFPGIAKMAGEPDLFSDPLHQHEEFHGGLERLGEYATKALANPTEYEWSKMKAIIDSFAPSLMRHLNEEIEVFLSFVRLDEVKLKKCWDEAEKAAVASGKIGYLYDIFPCVLGTCDKTFEGGNQFPPVPSVLPYAIKHWFGTYNPGAWRFNPCDFWGKPRPLQMLPENRA